MTSPPSPPNRRSVHNLVCGAITAGTFGLVLGVLLVSIMPYEWGKEMPFLVLLVTVVGSTIIGGRRGQRHP
jgi:hypothetical protein